jgi:hypothetical protein
LDENFPGGDVLDLAPTKSHPIYVAPDQSTAAEISDKNSPGSGVADHSLRAQSHPFVLAPDQSISAEVLNEKIPGGLVNDRAQAQSHAITVMYDHSMAAEVLAENASVGGLAASNDAQELAGGSSEIDRVPKMERIKDGADLTVQVSHYSSVPIALVDTVTAERLLLGQVKSAHTCTLIATYRSDEAVDTVCQLTKNLLEDGEADVSAIDVGGLCISKPGKPCNRARSRRLNKHAASDISGRSVQAIDTTPPTSAPTPGYIVFTAKGFELTCEQIANRLGETSGVITVSVDVEGIVKVTDPQTPENRQAEVDRFYRRVQNQVQTNWGIDMLNISSLWSLPRKRDVKICIIDTGYDIGHPDLPTDNVNGWVKESTCGSDSKHADWWTDESYNSHGIHVSGIISTIMNYRSEFDRHSYARIIPAC